MAEVEVVWLIDMDPPSEAPDGRGFYPAGPRDDPPDAALMRARIALLRDVVAGEAPGTTVVTVHTSPRFRTTFLEPPYTQAWADMEAAGAVLALHPHEDRADGSSLYDDPDHLAGVVRTTMARAGRAGLRLRAFRSGTFAFNPCLPGLLAELGIDLDLSAAPGFRDPRRGIDWPEGSEAGDMFLRQGVPVAEIPIGWDGAGGSLDANYLFNERMDLAGLVRVWDRLRARAEARQQVARVNFLAHGFGLADPGWRRQALRFLDHVRGCGGRLVAVDSLRPPPCAAQ